MSSLPLKHRPNVFEDVIGNEAAISSIITLISRELEDIPNSWLLTGPPGCGKTTLARIIKDELGCEDLSFSEYNSSNTRGIDTIRAIQESSKLSPMAGDVKVYLFDECHMWTKDAMNAALKMLEDAPKNTFFLLATTNPEKLIKPILSRCTQIKVDKVSSKKIIPLLKNILDKEEMDIPDDVISLIASSCDGTPRVALKMLDTILDMEDPEQMKACISEGIPDEETLFSFCKMLIDRKTKWKELAAWLKSNTSEPETVRRGIIGILNGFLLNSGDIHIAEVMDCFTSNYYDSGYAGLTLSVFQTTTLE